MAPARGEMYRVKWNNFTGVLRSNLRRYLHNESFADVTLACEGQRIRCHRLVLASASEYFESLLNSNEFPDAATANTIIYLKDVKFWELKILVEYLYNGEITISEEKLRKVSAIAESLRIKGFAGAEGVIDEDIAKDLGLTNVRTRPAPSSTSTAQIPASQSTAAPGIQENALKRKSPAVSSPPRLIKIQKPAVETGRTQNPTNSNGFSTKVKLLPRSDAISDRLQQNQLTVKDELKMYPTQNIKIEEGIHGFEDDENELEIAEVETSVSSESDSEDEASGQDMQQLEISASANSGQPRKSVYKYSQEVRDSVLNSLQTGMSLRQCSDSFGIPRKTIAKWKQRETEDGNNGLMPYESIPVVTSHPPNVGLEEESNNRKIISVSVPAPKRRAPGVSIDTGDRAERLDAAMKLALSGTTVRQAAVTYEIPRTTLCAYMKRRGVQTTANKRSSTGPIATGGGVGGGGTSLNSSVEDFPIFGLSDLMEDVDGDGDFGDEEDELY